MGFVTAQREDAWRGTDAAKLRAVLLERQTDRLLADSIEQKRKNKRVMQQRRMSHAAWI